MYVCMHLVFIGGGVHACVPVETREELVVSSLFFPSSTQDESHGGQGSKVLYPQRHGTSTWLHAWCRDCSTALCSVACAPVLGPTCQSPVMSFILISVSFLLGSIPQHASPCLFTRQGMDLHVPAQTTSLQLPYPLAATNHWSFLWTSKALHLCQFQEGREFVSFMVVSAMPRKYST